MKQNYFKEKRRLAYEKHKERDKAKMKEYYQKHKGVLIPKQREYYYKNKEKVSKQKKEYYFKNLEKSTLRLRRYYQNNRDKILKQLVLFRKNNKDVLTERRRKYAKKYPEKVKARNDAKYRTKLPKDKKCEICKTNPVTERHHPDYSQPLNVQFVCHPCNCAFDRRIP